MHRKHNDTYDNNSQFSHKNHLPRQLLQNLFIHQKKLLKNKVGRNNPGFNERPGSFLKIHHYH